MKRKVIAATVVIVLLAGMLLPATQSTRHPRPEVDAVCGVLYFLERPARGLGLEDRDACMIPVRAASTLLWGLALGCGIAALARRPPSRGRPREEPSPGRGNRRESEGSGP